MNVSTEWVRLWAFKRKRAAPPIERFRIGFARVAHWTTPSLAGYPPKCPTAEEDSENPLPALPELAPRQLAEKPDVLRWPPPREQRLPRVRESGLAQVTEPVQDEEEHARHPMHF